MLTVLLGCLGFMAFAAPGITPKVDPESDFSPLLVEDDAIIGMQRQPLHHPLPDSLQRRLALRP